MNTRFHLRADPNHHAILGLHLRSPENLIARAMHLAGAPAHVYTKDDDFAALVLKDIRNYSHGKALADLLDADRFAMEGNKLFGCHKAASVRSWLKHWRASSFLRNNFPASEYVAKARRVCCGCHELGSFALSHQQRVQAQLNEERAKDRYARNNRRTFS
jgi:hypothetical protein